MIPLLHGHYSLVTAYRIDAAARRDMGPDLRDSARETLAALTTTTGAGWTALVALVGSEADVLVMHVRSSLDELVQVRGAFASAPMLGALIPTFSFLSVAEVALYDLALELEAEAGARGGEVGDAHSQTMLAARLEAERSVSHVQRRLSPELPADKPYVCFYPMSKRRQAPHNWYTLSLDERVRLMHAHGRTGRRYRGRISQIVSGATGLADWEWGVTLFARDPLDIKGIVTDMRYDEVSALYAEFGPFYMGRRMEVEEWLGQLAGR